MGADVDASVLLCLIFESGVQPRLSHICLQTNSETARIKRAKDQDRMTMARLVSICHIGLLLQSVLATQELDETSWLQLINSGKNGMIKFYQPVSFCCFLSFQKCFVVNLSTF